MIEHNPIYFGSDIKLKVTLDFGEVSPDSIDWDILLSCGNKKILFNKSQLIKIDAKNYLICVKSPNTSKGNIKAVLTVHFNDSDFEDNIHTVVRPYNTSINII